MRIATGLVLAALVCLAAPPAQAACPVAQCIYVDGTNCTNPPDGGTGTQVDPFCKIQAGFVEAAVQGTSQADTKTILVLPGTYPECVQAWGFTIDQDLPVHLVADAFDPLNKETSAALTTIDGSDAACADRPALTLGGTGASLEGFRVTGGQLSGVFAQGSVRITNNLIDGNTSNLGGGIYMYTAACYYGDNVTADITDNIVRGNSAFDPAQIGEGDGGGIFVWAREFTGATCGTSTVNVERNTVENNTIDNPNINPQTGGLYSALGGGMYLLTDTVIGGNASIRVTQNVVTGNSALPNTSAYGGGIWANTYGQGLERIDILDNVVTNNSVTADGGGISAWVTPVVNGDHRMNVHDNEVASNSADANGGGVDLFVFTSDLGTGQRLALDVAGNEIASNSGGFDGGGILAAFSSERSTDDPVLYPQHPTPAQSMSFRVRNNLVTDNTAGLGGGGAILLPLANGDPFSPVDGDGNYLACDIHLPATADIELSGNIVANNHALAISTPQIDIIGGGILAIPASVGEALASVTIDNTTVTGNVIDFGFVGGIEMQVDTREDCCAELTGQAACSGYSGARGDAAVTILSSIVTDNDASGIGGPPPVQGLDNLTATVNRSFVFGHDIGPFENFESTVFTTPPPGNFQVDPLLNASFAPGACSPVFANGACAGDPARACDGAMGCRTCNADTSPGEGDYCTSDGDCPNGACESVERCETAGSVDTADFNRDTGVNGVDVQGLALAIGSAATDPPPSLFNLDADLDGNGVVDGNDLSFMATDFGNICP